MKIKKVFSILFWNILMISLLVLISDIIIYKYHAKINYNNHTKINNFKYMPYLPIYLTDLEKHFNGKDNLFYGRKPDGIEYKDKTPIILMGCSYAFGQYLNYNQTFSYKLAHTLKRPVYNRGISGGGLQHMYLQATSKSLYETISDTDTVIYIMISDHYRRSMLTYFDVLDHHILSHCSIKNNQIKIDDYKNPIKNFFKSLYTVKYINHIYAGKYINDPKNQEKITDNAVLYFIESRKELEKSYNKKLNFSIILYEDCDFLYKDPLVKKLKDNGFNVFSTKDLTSEKLNTEKYFMKSNNHPNEEAWNLLTPLIINKLNL